MAINILVVAPQPAADKVAQTLRRELDATVQIGSHQREAYTGSHREGYSLVLLDENLAAAEPDATHALFADAQTSLVLELNLAICGPERVLRQVKGALSRRALDENRARSAASQALHDECNASLTGLLLESQLALRQAGPEATQSLQRLVHLAGDLRDRLRGM